MFGRLGSRFSLTGLLAVLLVGVVGISAYLLLRQLTSIEERMSSLDQQLQTAMDTLEAVAEKAEYAGSVAREAEKEAFEAVRGRAVAEASEAAAQEQTRRALEQAALARNDAHLALEKLERIRQQRDQELNRLQKAMSRIAETRRTALGLVMNLGSDKVQFDFDKASLRPENRELLSRIAGVLLTSDHYRVQVYGHTDDIGTEEYNVELSERRAEAVCKYLTQAGIDPRIISTKGFGKSNPLVPGVSSQARARNRRVEIAIIDTFVSYKRLTETEEK
jgi:outer membrane protein OmpA-like peptidoglycan-associated protein